MERSLVRSKVKTNYFRFLCDSTLFKYKIETEPKIPSASVGLLYRILGKIRDQISKLLDPYQPSNFVIYSPIQIDETTLTSEYDNVTYTIKLVPIGLLETSGKDKEAMVFLGRFFKVLQGSLKLKQVGKKYFNDKEQKDFREWKLSVWPGYQTSLNFYGNQFLINVDSCFKVLREKSVLEFIDELMPNFKGNQERVKEEMVGMIVMTK